MRVTRLLLPILGLALCASAQDDGPDAKPRPPEIDEVLIPEKAFDDVFERFPKGAILTREELNTLVNKAAKHPAPPPPPTPSPIPGSLENLKVEGTVGADQIATIRVTARVRLLHDEGRIPLPLKGQGVTELLLDGQPARVLEQGQHLLVLVSGAGTHSLTWRQLVKVQPGEERGSGVLELALPGAASGRLDLHAAGELELNRVTGGVGWLEESTQGDASTHMAVAFGDLSGKLSLAFRPRRAVSEVTPYSTGDVYTLFDVRNDVVTLSSTLAIGIYRAPREVLHVDLPPGFVLRGLRPISQGLGELTPIQDGRRVRIELTAPRQGDLFLQLIAERPLRAGEALRLAAVGLPDTDRVAGMLAVSRGDDTRIRFEAEQGLERADLATLPQKQPEGILRAYRHGEAEGGLTLEVRPLEPRVDLSMRVAFQLEARSVRAVAAFKYRVREGRVFALTADIPPGFVVEDAAVRLVGQSQAPEHELDRTYTTGADGEQTHLQVKLPRGLEAGQELVLLFQAQREEETALAGRSLQIPQLSGSPASTSSGYLGFAPDAAYRLQGEGLKQLTGVPAAELPKLGLQVPGLVLGYRIEGDAYGGALQLTRRETRLSADLRVRHRVRERVVKTDVVAKLNVQGAPLETLDVLVPAGLGASARFEHPDLHEDRERIQSADVPAGWERYRLRFVRRQQGDVTLTARLQSKLPASEEGQDAVEVAALPSLRLVQAFRQRGQIAIYSADATELEAVGSGVRELEVAEVETLGDYAGYPLFAYAFVGEQHAVGLKVRRHEAAPMLTAVAESLLLQTTSGADGHSRHTATFTVKNLGNQFFALRLPEGAKLWSVVVDGEGVKPAERDGLMIVPIPVVGEKSAHDAVDVTATYTVDRGAWGSMDDLRLVAPELCLGSEDVVPVLKTEWQLTLPDDYLVLEVEGNVRQDMGAPSQAPLLVRTLERMTEGGEWLFGLALLGLLVAASASARRTLLVALLGAEDARRGATQSVGNLFSQRVTWIVLAVIAGVGFLGWLLLAAVGKSADFGGVAYAPQAETRAAADYGYDGAASGEGYEYEEAAALSFGDDAPAQSAPQPQVAGRLGDAKNEMPMDPNAAESRRRPMAPPPPPESKPMRSPKVPAPARRELENLRKQKEGLSRDRAAAEKKADKSYAPPQEPMADPAPMDMDEADMPESEAEPSEDAWGNADGESPDDDMGEGGEDSGMPSTGSDSRFAGGKRAEEQAQQQGLGRYRQSNAGPEKPIVVLEEEVELSKDLLEQLPKGTDLSGSAGGGGTGGDSYGGVTLDGVTVTSESPLVDLKRVDALVEQNANDPTVHLLRAKLREARGDLQGALQDAERSVQLRGGSEAYKAQGQILERLGRTAEAEVARTRGEFMERAQDPGTLGDVGLSSLVLGWTPVGKRYAFSRDGGGAELGLELTRTGALVTAFGMLALIGCALGLLLPLLTRAHVLAVLIVGVGVLSALPILVLPAKFVPICNALALGLVCAAPIHLAWALARAWDTGPLSKLGKAMREERKRRRGLGAAPRAATLLLLGLVGGLSGVQADEPAPQRPKPFRVYVPYDSDSDSLDGDRVYVPNDVYAELWRRAFPEKTPVLTPQPPRNALITRADYAGEIDVRGKLDLTCTLRVDVLAEGWQTVSLGLQGTGLSKHRVRGGKPNARVMSAPAGGYQLIARGPAVYEVELELIAPSAGGRYAFSTAPCAASRMELSSAVANRRVVVGGANAQRDLDAEGTRIEASVGGAQNVAVALVAREVLSAGGASEASANTRSVVYVQRGRIFLRSLTEFAVSGAGREGFTFELPKGFEVTNVQSQLLRGWSVADGVLRVDLRRPSDARHQVFVQGELELDASEFAAPHVVPQGVTREQGELGLAVEDGLRVLPQKTTGLRRAGTSNLTPLLQGLSNPRQPVEIASAYSFVRRPCTLELQRVEEELEVRVKSRISARVDTDEVALTANLRYEVRRGKAYELNVLVPAGYVLVGRETALDLREVGVSDVDAGRVYRLGLGSGLKGTGEVQLQFVRRHSLDNDQAALPFCDVRALGVDQETADVAVAVANGLRLRVAGEPRGLTPRDVRSVSRGWPQPQDATWVVGYRRGESAAAGLAQATLQLRRPQPKVTGSWVLHAQVERDVVRYDLRALYEIDEAGARRFVLEIPESVGARYQVDGQNLREVRRSAGKDGRQRIEVSLQSAVESFYTLSCTWEETVRPGEPFSLSKVALSDLDRVARGFVLVEKGAGVPERLEETGREGAIAPQRAADAPALPPGRGPRDFALSYRVETERAAPWSVEWKLSSTGQQRQPSPARVLWSRLVSVYDGEGLVRHRVTYRVRNLRLQFLTLKLPQVETEQGVRPADVWSVFVDGQPKRLHHRGELLLIPLPKRTDADLSFDVEITYATQLPTRFRVGQVIRPQPPVLETERVPVERNFWTLYLPEQFTYGNVSGTMQKVSGKDIAVQKVARMVDESREVQKIASKGEGQSQSLALRNLSLAQDKVRQQLQEIQREAGSLKQEYAKELQEAEKAYRGVEQSRGDLQRKLESQSEQSDEQELRQYAQTSYGWNRNAEVFKRDRAKWTGVGKSKQRPGQQDNTASTEEDLILNIQEGDSLNLQNAAVVTQQRLNGKLQAQQIKGNLGAPGNRPAATPEETRDHRHAVDGFFAVGGEVLPGSADPRGAVAEAGLLSLAVSFETPGEALHFEGTDAEALELELTVYPAEGSSWLTHLVQALALLALLAGAFRCGLFTRLGKPAIQALALIAVGALVGAIFAHMAGAVIALVAGLAGLRFAPAVAAAH